MNKSCLAYRCIAIAHQKSNIKKIQSLGKDYCTVIYMKLNICIFYMLLVIAFANAQESIVISGHVLSHNKKEPIEGAEIQVGSTYAISNAYGKFSLEVLKSELKECLKVSLLGYKKYEKFLNLEEKHHFKIYLEEYRTQLDEVTIRGNKKKSFLKKSALSSVLISKVNLERKKETSLGKSLANIAGIGAITIGAGQSKPTIRGLGFNRLVVMQNGIKHEAQQWGTDHGLEIDQNAIEQVEIYKGPLSLLVGSDAIGGAIVIKETQVPEKNTLAGKISINGQTNNDLVGFSSFVKGRRNHWYFKNSITVKDYADYKVPTNKISYNGFVFHLKKHQLRNTAGGEYKVSGTIGYLKEGLSNRTIISNVYEKNGFFANAHGLEVRKSTINYDADNRDIDLPRHEVNHFKITNETTVAEETYSLKITTGYQNNIRKEFSEPSEHGYMPKPSANLERKFDKSTYSINGNMKLFSMENHHIKLGVNTEYQKNNIGGWGYIIPAYARFTIGAYAYDKYRISSNLYLHGGLRYDYGILKTKQYKDWFKSPIHKEGKIIEEFLIRSSAKKLEFKSVSASLGTVFTKGNHTGKINVGKSFRIPLANELTSDGVNYHMYRYELGDTTLKAEEAYQLDLEYQYFVRKGSISVSPFINYFPNYIYLNPSFNYHEALQIYNYKQSKVFRAGGEITSTLAISNKMNLKIAGEYVYAEQLSGSKKGFTLPFSPPISVVFSTLYKLKDTRVFKNTVLGMSWRITGRQTAIVPPENKTKGYTVGNLTIFTALYNKHKKWGDIYFKINNILNTQYFNHTSFYRLIEVPEPGRNFSLEIQIPF
ncbi:TonB-dependent receptor [Tenacibaculum maritimum]